MKNEVIIIGENHYNTLGVIRSLGEKEIKSNIIVIDDKKYSYVSKSKYVKSYYHTEENEEKIKEILLTNFINKKEKAILIPTSDFAALFIDKNLKELQKNFICPNINNEQNKILEMMDKYNQYELAKENNINMAKTIKLNLSNIDEKELVFPCILKPITSAYGDKKDIVICQNVEEFHSSIINLKNKNYKQILFQELIDYDYECCIVGCSHNNNIIIPGIIKKIRIYPLKRGSNSFSKVLTFEDFNLDINSIIKFLQKLKYQGLFDIEIFIKNNKLYLNEINFRNSGNAYAYNYGKVNLVYLNYLSMANKDLGVENVRVNNSYYYVDEFLEIRQLIKGNISFKEYIKTFRLAKSYFVLNSKDVKPIFYIFLYKIFNK